MARAKTYVSGGRQFSFYITNENFDQLNQISKSKSLPKSRIINRLIEVWLKRQKT